MILPSPYFELTTNLLLDILQTPNWWRRLFWGSEALPRVSLCPNQNLVGTASWFFEMTQKVAPLMSHYFFFHKCLIPIDQAKVKEENIWWTSLSLFWYDEDIWKQRILSDVCWGWLKNVSRDTGHGYWWRFKSLRYFVFNSFKWVHKSTICRMLESELRKQISSTNEKAGAVASDQSEAGIYFACSPLWSQCLPIWIAT